MSSKIDIAPLATHNNHWKNEVRSLVLPEALVWPDQHKQVFQDTQQRLIDFFDQKHTPKLATVEQSKQKNNQNRQQRSSPLSNYLTNFR